MTTPHHTPLTGHDGLAAVESAGNSVGSISVHVSYEIIRLFSEGLYQSPHKAIEELVSNSYDADATQAHVLLPDVGETEQLPDAETVELSSGAVVAPAPLWVIDNGTGLDPEGFAQLWRVADSRKREINSNAERPPIGQFGIGKLAAYVLAWRLTHISRVDKKIHLTSMNFRRIEGQHQYDNISPLDLELREVDEATARELLGDIERRDPAAWDMLFGTTASPTWTAAALSDFKDLYDKMAVGRLGWVLRTGLPLQSKFRIWLDGTELQSSKESLKTTLDFQVASDEDQSAQALSLVEDGNLTIPGIPGHLTGRVRLFEKKLTEGKSDQYGRSNGFFIKVRGRVINLEDELFGLPVLNHATWSRFSLELEADGLREHLLSSREGVRESEPIATLRQYLLGAFNQCRAAYDKVVAGGQVDLDITRLLSSAPSAYVTEPLVESVRNAVSSGRESFYVSPPPREALEADPNWMLTFARESEANLFEHISFEKTGNRDRAVRFFPDTRTLQINEEHPFIDKLITVGRSKSAATFFGSSELFVDALLQDYGIDANLVTNVLQDRDRVLRIIAGDQPSSASEALRLLKSAETHDEALERAVGAAFSVLGFEYQKRGGNVGGTDGVLYARLGKGPTAGLEDYKIVYDAKSTAASSVAASKIDILSLEDFRSKERAQFGFFIATQYAGEDDPTSKLNSKLDTAKADQKPVTTLKIDQLRRLVELHYRFGVTLTRMRSLFTSTHNVIEVDQWLGELEEELKQRKRVPLKKLLVALEATKKDALAVPTVHGARFQDPELMTFTPEDLLAHMSAVSTIVGSDWVEVNAQSSEVRLHARAAQISAEVERRLFDLLGVDTQEGIQDFHE